VRTLVPQGPNESSPVRSAGLAFLKSIRPGRDDRQMLAIAERRAKPKAECFYRPYGTDLPFASFPSTSYWATFVRSLRDGFSLTTNGLAQSRSRALKLTRMGSRRIRLACWLDASSRRPRRCTYLPTPDSLTPVSHVFRLAASAIARSIRKVARC
jgi:hypothetical protein